MTKKIVFSVLLIALSTTFAQSSSSVAVSDDTTEIQPALPKPASISLKPKTPNQNTEALIQEDLKLARDGANTGAIIYSLGVATEIIGAVIYAVDVVRYQKESNSSSTTSSIEPVSNAGAIIASIGGVASLGGALKCHLSGSTAHTVYKFSNEDVPNFKGWNFFGAGIGCSLVASILQFAEVPIAPTVLSLAGGVCSISAIVHSHGYTRKLYTKAMTLSNVQFSPIINPTALNQSGFKITANF